jgi:hypothetical protein
MIPYFLCLFHSRIHTLQNTHNPFIVVASSVDRGLKERQALEKGKHPGKATYIVAV